MSGSLTVGLDLGQATDYSALAVVERVCVLPPGVEVGSWLTMAELTQRLYAPTEELRVRHLQRWALGTAYHHLVADVGELLRRPELAGACLWFDRSGVGRGVGDLLVQAWRDGTMGSAPPVGVTITGADQPGLGTVPKRDLLTDLQILLQQGRLKIAAGLALGEVLERELTSFRMKISAAGRDSYDVQRREGEGHGDLVIAVALACRHANWAGQRPRLEASTG